MKISICRCPFAPLGAAFVALACLWASGVAFAQAAGATSRLHCNVVGSGGPEPLGGKEGHAFSVGEIVCRVEGGATDGGLLQGYTVYEWDKMQASLLSGLGVIRKPGATTAYQHSEGKVSLIVADGKVAGANYTGRGRITLASGAAAPLLGKTYTYAGRTTGPGQLTLEVKYD